MLGKKVGKTVIDREKVAQPQDWYRLIAAGSCCKDAGYSTPFRCSLKQGLPYRKMHVPEMGSDGLMRFNPAVTTQRRYRQLQDDLKLPEVGSSFLFGPGSAGEA